MTSFTSTNVFTISCLSIEPPPASVNLVLQYGGKPCKVSIALFVDYSSTIRTIRTIRFTILVLSIARPGVGSGTLGFG